MAATSLHLSDAENARYWSTVDDSSDCWRWTGPISKEGYGRFNVQRPDDRGRPRSWALAAHRVAWAAFHGEPDGVVQQTCGDRLCVRPAHLIVTPGKQPVPITGRQPKPPYVPPTRHCRDCTTPLERTAGRWPLRCQPCEAALLEPPVDRPRLLDLFCGAGGAGEGYRQAGFDVTGVDLVVRECGYPAGRFMQADVLDVLADTEFLRGFDLVHASPPCETHSRARHLGAGKASWRVDLIPPTREALEAAGVPFIMENVVDAPLRPDVLLCGSLFPELHCYDHTGRRWLQRHRIFESNLSLTAPPCQHEGAGVRPLGVYGPRGQQLPGGAEVAHSVDQARQLMGAPWMSWAALTDAIPPPYTRWLAGQALRQI